MLHFENDSIELNYKMCVHAINFPENAMWIGLAEYSFTGKMMFIPD